MAWKESSDIDDEKILMYDLRQIYANEIIRNTFNRIQFARENNNFPKWFQLLERDLKIEISKNLSEEELKDIDYEIKKAEKIIQQNEVGFLKKTDTNKTKNVEIGRASCRERV